MATDVVALKIGGPVTVTNTRSRLAIQPLLPGDQITTLVLHLFTSLEGGIPAGVEQVNVKLAVSEQDVANTDAAFDNVPRQLVNESMGMEFVRTADADGYWRLVLAIPLFVRTTQRGRHVTIDLSVSGGTALTAQGAAYVQVLRPSLDAAE